jgi:hypothetical protein
MHILPADRWVKLFMQPFTRLQLIRLLYVHISEYDREHLNPYSLVDHLVLFVHSLTTLSHPEVLSHQPVVSQASLCPTAEHYCHQFILSLAVDSMTAKQSELLDVVNLKHAFALFGEVSANLPHSDQVHRFELRIYRYYFSINAVGKALKSL